MRNEQPSVSSPVAASVVEIDEDPDVDVVPVVVFDVVDEVLELEAVVVAEVEELDPLGARQLGRTSRDNPTSNRIASIEAVMVLMVHPLAGKGSEAL